MTGLLLALLVGSTPQMPLSVASTDDALAVFANPAGLGAGRRADLYCFYNFRERRLAQGLALAMNLGPLGAFWEPGSRYGLALGAGRDGAYGGVRFVRDSVSRWDLGAMYRPAGWLSLGATWNDLGRDWGSVVAGLAVRPLGSRLTLHGDVCVSEPVRPSLGLEAEPIDGIQVSVKVRPDEYPSMERWSVVAGLTLGFGRTGVGGVATSVGSADLVDQAGFLIRVGGEFRRSLVRRPKCFLELTLAGSTADQKPGFSLMGSRPTRTTWELLDLVSQVQDDDRIQGLVVRIDGFSAGFAQLNELRAALAQLRNSGKKVFVYAPSLGMGEYYLASVADRIYCHPLGDVYIPGMQVSMTLLKGGLEKLGLEVDYQRHGRYKSAVESFDADSTSPENREQLEAFLDALFEEFLAACSEGRGMSRSDFEELVNQGLFLAGDAAEVGLIDGVCYHDQLDSLLRQETSGFRKMKEKKYRDSRAHLYAWRGKPLVALVYASGTIASGKSGTDFLSGGTTMGARTMVRAIRSARKDDRVKAIVLRVDSPGGSGYASDLIWRELELAKADKPLIVSMGNVAASGGYYISCGADQVLVNPGTLTGSIGVLGLKFVTEGLYNKLGLRREIFSRGEHAGALSDYRPYSEEEDSILQYQMDEFYRQFVQKVAEGRAMTFEEVDSVAQGRIWAGVDAQRVGLVDTLGGLTAAIDCAKKLAGIDDCELVYYPQPGGGMADRVARYVAGRIFSRDE